MSMLKGIAAVGAAMAMTTTVQALKTIGLVVALQVVDGTQQSARSTTSNSELGGKFKFNYSPSNGSVDNVRRVSLGDFHAAWGHVGQAFQSWNGIGF